MSDFVKQNSLVNKRLSAESGWVVLSSMESRIKEKIENLGIPLKDWSVQINYGIKTGYNEAFIINEETKEALIKKSPKSAEIIRPILRGRDIQKYNADWQGLYLIVSHNGYKNFKGNIVNPIQIEDYPSVKTHLDKFWEQIYCRQDKGITPYNLRSCVYMEDFSRPKIMYPNMTKYMPFIYDTNGYFINDKGFIITGNNIAFLTAFLNSSIFKFCYRENFPELQGGTRELRKVFLDKISIVNVSAEQDKIFGKKIDQIQKLKGNDENTLHLERELDQMIFDLYDLTDEEEKAIGFIEIT